MTYKQALFFVGQCLSLAQYPERKDEIKKLINSDYIDWDLVVKLSSNQLVVPTLYLNLKRNALLKLLPQGLELYFKEITDANSERNRNLLKQAKQLAILFEQHQIKALFLKGMAHLIASLYRDIGERMIGDIDILVTKNQVEEVAAMLKKEGYYNRLKNEGFAKPRHYSRLAHQDYIASVEIHWDILEEGHKHNLNYDVLFDDKQKINPFYVPSFKHQALHNVLNAQVNDHAYKRGLILMRQLYDCFLLSFKPDVKEALKAYKRDSFLKNLYLKWVSDLFKTEKILYQKSLLLSLLLLRYQFMTNKKLYKIASETSYFSNRFYNYPRQIVLSFSNKSKRKNILKSLTTKGWLKRHIESYKKRQ